MDEGEYVVWLKETVQAGFEVELLRDVDDLEAGTEVRWSRRIRPRELTSRLSGG